MSNHNVIHCKWRKDEQEFNIFSNPTSHEILRARGLVSNTRLYGPNLEKEMKFVAHNTTISHDFISWQPLCIPAKQGVVDCDSIADDHETKGTGFLLMIKIKMTLDYARPPFSNRNHNNTNTNTSHGYRLGISFLYFEESFPDSTSLQYKEFIFKFPICSHYFHG